MKSKNILKEAAVLLIGVLLICTSVAAIATKSDKTNLTIPSLKIDTPINNVGLGASSNVLWDNWFEDWNHGLAAQHEPPGTPDRLDAFPADDFMFDENTDVYRVFWGGGYWYCNSAEGPKDCHFDWNVTFFEDDGSGYHPGDIYAGPFTIPDTDISRSDEMANDTLWNGRWIAGYWAWLPNAVKFNADTKYWITIYGINKRYPQSFWTVHNESMGGILLHEANWKSEYFGYPDWTNLSVLYDGEPHDMTYALLGLDPDFEVTISKGLGITATITNHGLLDTTNVTATFTTTGGLVLGRTKIIDVGDLDIGDTGTARTIFIGIGRIAIDVEVTCNWGMSGYTNTSGFLLLIFVL